MALYAFTNFQAYNNFISTFLSNEFNFSISKKYLIDYNIFWVIHTHVHTQIISLWIFVFIYLDENLLEKYSTIILKFYFVYFSA